MNYNNFMARSCPIWVLLLLILLGLIFIVAFGWSVKSTLSGSARSGIFGELAVEISSFPNLVKNVLDDALEVKGKPVRVPNFDVDLTEFEKIKSINTIEIQGLMVRASPAALEENKGWRILVGAFTIDGEFENAAIALNSNLEVANVWHLTEQNIVSQEARLAHRKFIHGLDLMSDGSVIYTFDGGVSIQRIDWCGKRMWATGGGFHHTVTLEDNERYAWSLKGNALVRIETKSGHIVQEISMDNIIAANPDIDVLGARRRTPNDLGKNSRKTNDPWMEDPFHLNDVDPLPKKLSEKFASFEEGDLLVSARNINLVFIIDPNSNKIKWWRSGVTTRQHDPDWGVDGRIHIYDNRMGHKFSRLISLSPDDFKYDVLYDGAKSDFYSRIRGKHQILNNGGILLTSPQQGRVMELDPKGNVTIEFVNRDLASNNENYVISEAKWLPENTFDIGRNQLCN